MKKTNKRKVAIFDFGGVLFKITPKKMFEDLFKQDGKSEEDLNYFLENIFTQKERSKTNYCQSANEVLNPLSKKHPKWAKYIKAFSANEKFLNQVDGTIDKMPETLKTLKEKGFEIYGLTNWAGDTFDALDKKYSNITSMFNKIVVSGKYGIKKPDPKFFELAHKEFGSPKEAVFFDDKEKNTQAANKYVGWTGVTFKNAETVKTTLAL